jgi:diacylglycerol diphosphate phosphatase / phosphatidate phosphatase
MAFEVPTRPLREPQRARFQAGIRPLRTIPFDKPAFQNLVTNLRLWFLATWLDWLFLILAGASAAAVWVIPHNHNRLFPITFSESGDIVWPEVAFPYVEPIFDSTVAGILCTAIPIVSMLIAQIWVRNFLDFANGCLGLVYALVTGTLFQVVLKKVIGGLRPHFLAVCEPRIPIDRSLGQGFQGIMFTVDQICTGDKDKIDNAIESFPSGHSNIAWAGLGYLAIYLWAHLGIRSISRRRPSYWRMLMVVSPLFFATYIASTLALGYHHHGYDIIFGSLIGMVMAVFGYRMMFASVLNPRGNTVPLIRGEGDQVDDEERVHGLDSVNDKTHRRYLSGEDAGFMGHRQSIDPRDSEETRFSTQIGGRDTVQPHGMTDSQQRAV